MPPTRMLTDPNQRAITVKNPGKYRTQFRQLKRQKEQAEGTQSSFGKNSGANNFIPKNSSNSNNNNNKNSNGAERKPKIVYPPCET